jgi:hypothetical protein
MLYEAIVANNLSSVKRMVSSGIGHNTVLHSPNRWESATILSTAAFQGNLSMVHYLVQAGASVNFQVSECMFYFLSLSLCIMNVNPDNNETFEKHFFYVC